MNCIFGPCAVTFLAALLFSCDSNEKSGDESVTDQSGLNGGVAEVTEVASNLILTLSTDKACYSPGETITFTAEGSVPSDATVRYTNGADIVAERTPASSTWTWTAPSENNKGYLATIYRTDGDGTEVVLGTVGVDVSDDWTRFPRYGFVATFDQSKMEAGVIESEIAFLNRCHINGVQFQDWHNKHHWPLGGTRDNLYDTYKDIANRDIYTSVVKDYISTIHSYGMKAMFYNLCYGALDDAASDGVKEEWYIFKGQGRVDKDYHDLSDSWKSDIFLVDPSNTGWQDYIAERNDDVYANFDFDGYQIDQLGDRGTRYNYNGVTVNMPKGYGSFITAMKAAHPSKRLVMNAVSGYGASSIASTGDVDFLYNEVWDDQNSFDDLHTIIYTNDNYSSNSLRTVFAAYMNYDKGNSEGWFNTPGVLLTDAVMMALGGTHLELGDHMLTHEYFPYDGLKMDDNLKDAIVRYYDFQTAYENLLQDAGTSAEVTAVPAYTGTSGSLSTNAWPPVKGAVTAYAKQTDGKEIVHLLNFINADSLSWRDLNGTMPEPAELSSLPMKLTVSSKVKKLWAASPDYLAGAPRELAFVQTNGTVTFTLPNLKYWTMLVFEFE